MLILLGCRIAGGFGGEASRRSLQLVALKYGHPASDNAPLLRV